MEIEKLYPEYYRMPRTPDASVWQRGSPAFAGSIFNSSPQVDPGVQFDVFETRQAVDKVDKLDSRISRGAWQAAGVIPTFRRLNFVPDRIKEGNYEGAVAQAAIAGVNIFGDMREVGLAVDEGVNIFKTRKLPSIKDYKGQHAMTLLDGTIAEGLFEKVPLLKKINDYDKVLYDTSFGKFLQRTLGLSIDDAKTELIEKTPTKIPLIGKEIPPATSFIQAHNFKGDYFQQLAGRTLYRISKLGLITSAALEVPALIKSITKTEGSFVDKAKAFGKQLIKSTGNVVFITAGVAIAGAVLVPSSLILGLVGMAAGSAVGIMAANALSKEVDKLTT